MTVRESFFVLVIPQTKETDDKHVLIKLLRLPVAGALLLAAASITAAWIAAMWQSEVTERMIAAEQIRGVSEAVATMPGPGEAEVRNYAATLVPYGRFAVPTLMGMLDRPFQESQHVVHGLVQIAIIYDEKDEVRRAMVIVLKDSWQTYSYDMHWAALNVMKSIATRSDLEFLKNYDPALGISDWDEQDKTDKSKLTQLVRRLMRLPK